MANPAAAPEPSMEEILASIRQIISEDAQNADKAGAEPAATSTEKSGDSQKKKPAASAAAKDTDGSVAEDRDADEPAEAEPAKDESVKAEPAKAQAAKAEPAKQDTAKADAGKRDTAKAESAKADAAKDDLAKAKKAFAGDDNAAGESDAVKSQAKPANAKATGGKSGDQTEKAADDPAKAPQNHPVAKESKSMAMPAESKKPSLAPSGEDALLSEDSQEVIHGAFSSLTHTILAQNARTLEDLVTEMLHPMLKGWLDDNLPSLVEQMVKQEIDRVSRGRR